MVFPTRWPFPTSQPFSFQSCKLFSGLPFQLLWPLFDFSNRLRQLVCGERLPQRKRGLKRGDMDELSKLGILRKLTRSQKEVVLRVVAAEDYLLVRGYPGTGKSTTISVLIHCLLALGKTILLAAYTNTAVDSILEKLVQKQSHQCEILRLGPLDRIKDSLHGYAERGKLRFMKSLQDVTDLYEKPKVVAGTCHALFNHPIFSRRKFDVCIVDEASQTLLPVSLGPLFCADRFVLVGDPNQLSPLIVNAEKEAENTQLSLLELLLEHCEKAGVGKNAVCDLTQQFRMNEEILRIPNAMFYDNKLECSEDQKDETIKVPTSKMSKLNNPKVSPLFSSSLPDSFIFADLSNVSMGDQYAISKTSNQLESSLIVAICRYFVEILLLPEQDIGVISPFSDQVRQITFSLQNCGLSRIEVNTIDQYQGKEKNVILLSLVKCGTSSASEERLKGILTNAKRLNVALTRAKLKLIAVGALNFLRNAYEPFSNLFSLLKNNQILQLDNNDFTSLVNFSNY